MSDLEYCSTLCLAAKHMGMGMRERRSESGFSFDWIDGLGGVATIKGPEHKDKKTAMRLACETLANYLQIKKQP